MFLEPDPLANEQVLGQCQGALTPSRGEDAAAPRRARHPPQRPREEFQPYEPAATPADVTTRPCRCAVGCSPHGQHFFHAPHWTFRRLVGNLRPSYALGFLADASLLLDLDVIFRAWALVFPGPDWCPHACVSRPTEGTIVAMAPGSDSSCLAASFPNLCESWLDSPQRLHFGITRVFLLLPLPYPTKLEPFATLTVSRPGFHG